MGGRSKSGGGEAEQARKDEQARQDRIRQGTERINSIFDGATVGTGQIGAGAGFNPSSQYYLADGSAWTPTAPVEPQPTQGAGPQKNYLLGDRGGLSYTTPGTAASEAGGAPMGMRDQLIAKANGGNGQTGKSAADQFNEMLASGKLFSGTSKSGGFNDEYFDKRRQSYIDYATPQLEDQKGKAQKELTFALTRGGLLNSSVRADKTGELQQLYDLNKQQIADQALSHATEARNAVEDARANLISTLNATGDAEGAANAAISRASALSQPAAYSPLAQLFTDFTAGLGAQAALERANYYSGGQTGGRYSTGLFTPKSSSVKVQ